MGKNERQAYLKAIRSRYRRARKKVKVTILDEFCSVCRYNRKYAIRLLNQRAKTNKKRRSGPKPTYASAELLTALKRIWFASDQMCSKKLKAAIPLWLPFYETVYKTLSPETQEKLLMISASTIDRVLKPVGLHQISVNVVIGDVAVKFLSASILVPSKSVDHKYKTGILDRIQFESGISIIKISTSSFDH
jgi:hypothetical protein